ncbi:MAG TPA: hypothetical protein VF070_01315, partial [Streptosporangiaceae bacterium]
PPGQATVIDHLSARALSVTWPEGPLALRGQLTAKLAPLAAFAAVVTSRCPPCNPFASVVASPP